MTSSILPPRSDLAPCSPITQARASTTLDFPEPLGPTMQVMPGSSWSVVDEAKDLNPLRVRLFRYNVAPHVGDPATVRTALRRPGVSGWTAGARYDERGKCSAPHPTQHHPRSRASGVVRRRRVLAGLDAPLAAAEAVAQDHQLLALLSRQRVHPAGADLVE